MRVNPFLASLVFLCGAGQPSATGLAACRAMVGLHWCIQIGWMCPHQPATAGPGWTPVCPGTAPQSRDSNEHVRVTFHPIGAAVFAVASFGKGGSTVGCSGCLSRCHRQGRTVWGCSRICRAPSGRVGSGDIWEARAVGPCMRNAARSSRAAWRCPCQPR